jgi:hypothetical protein
MNINKIPKRFLRNVVTHKMVITKSDWDNRPEDDKSKWNKNIRKSYEMEESVISNKVNEGVIEVFINKDEISTRIWSEVEGCWKSVSNLDLSKALCKVEEVSLSDPINEKFLTEAVRRFEDHVNNLTTEIKDAEWKLITLEAEIKESKEKLAEYQSILES